MQCHKGRSPVNQVLFGAPADSRPKPKGPIATWVQAGPELGTQCVEDPRLFLWEKMWKETVKLWKARHA